MLFVLSSLAALLIHFQETFLVVLGLVAALSVVSLFCAAAARLYSDITVIKHAYLIVADFNSAFEPAVSPDDKIMKTEEFETALEEGRKKILQQILSAAITNKKNTGANAEED